MKYHGATFSPQVRWRAAAPSAACWQPSPAALTLLPSLSPAHHAHSLLLHSLPLTPPPRPTHAPPPQFWLRVFDSVLLPIFDHVRAEVTDTTTFTDDKRRAEVDSWLYDTCTRTLQHIVDIVVQYYAAVSGGWRWG